MAENTRDYKATTLLPQTAFPMKANLAQREPEQLARWQADKLYERMLAEAKGTRFILHDGPPYANGHLHEGHFLNKILKDIVVKTALLNGHPSEYIPGWDCHGLPIELSVDKELGSKKRALPAAEIRAACRAHAEKYLDIQREEFKRLGVFGRWEAPYRTMDFGYEAEVVRELSRAVRAGAVYRGKKPVFWCWNDRTALAEAELEYQDDDGPSVYVGFDLVPDALAQLSALVPGLAGRTSAQLAIWTTTPWSLPGNLAIAVNSQFVYVAYDLRGVPTLIARDLLFAVLAIVGPDELREGERQVAGQRLDVTSLAHPERILGYVEGRALEKLAYRHPFLDRTSQVVLAEHVTLEAGTGLVHTAPGHGQEDYEVGLKYGLPILVPIDDGGVFTAEAGPFAGQFFEKAVPQIVALLVEQKRLLNPPGQTNKHSYPHCWRCKKPVMLRATDQWFVAMGTKEDPKSIRARALAQIDIVRWIPSWGRDRIRGMLLSRPDWCISRQRVWGTPIPALYCEGCGEASLDPKVLDHVAERFEQEGADSWFAHPASAFVPEGYHCPKCAGSRFRKESDILDVWFESGMSQAAVARKRLSWPVDLYLEGSDQHRGWFQASLLCALAAGETESPFRACLTHGFVVDGQGRKLSKSLGNSLDPQKMLRQYGAEIVRLWAASEDYRDDIRLSDEILQRLADAYRKLRNTLRFSLGVLEGFDPARDAAPKETLAPLDRYLRSRLHRFLRKVTDAYAAYDFHVVARAAVDFVAVELSALYFDVSKDRLYCGAARGADRRSAQTAIHELADTLCRVLAPILSFTAEEAYGYVPGHRESVFLAGMPKVDASAIDEALEGRFEGFLRVREDVQSEMEVLRRAKSIGSSQEARVELWEDSSLGQPPMDLGELFIVSQVVRASGAAPESSVAGAKSGVRLRVSTAEGQRCDRCWNYRLVGEAREGGFLCARCLKVLAGLEPAPGNSAA